MKAAHFLPHGLGPGPEGHRTRHEALRDGGIPDLVPVVDPQSLLLPWDLVIVDTFPLGQYGELSRILPLVTARKVLISRATDTNEWPGLRWYDKVISPGPYEGTPGTIVGPLVMLGRRWSKSRFVPLIVPARGQSDEWWVPLAHLGYRMAGTPAITEIAQSQVVIGTGGVTLYEALWSGCRYVALPLSTEQRGRVSRAVDAGEAIVCVNDPTAVPAAVEQVRRMRSLGRRPSGVAAAVKLILP